MTLSLANHVLVLYALGRPLQVDEISRSHWHSESTSLLCDLQPPSKNTLPDGAPFDRPPILRIPRYLPRYLSSRQWPEK